MFFLRVYLVRRSQIQLHQPDRKTNRIMSDFSFPNEFIGDYPTCLYGMKSELNIQAIIPCEIYICSSAFLQPKIRGEQRKPTDSPYRSRTDGFSNHIHVFGFIQIHTGRALPPTFKKCPAILQMVSLKEIASYLKITPVHMSRIRQTSKVLTTKNNIGLEIYIHNNIPGVS